ncbi:Protein of unknown function [Propionibacterium freudenreichii]|nr:Protein of unknown function [Propionibacterium freudenreichii]
MTSQFNKDSVSTVQDAVLFAPLLGSS